MATEQTLKITELNAVTGKSVTRNLSEEELLEQQNIESQANLLLTALEAKAAARQSALAKLAELGLTEEEIAAL